MAKRQYEESAVETKAPGYINIRGIMPKNGETSVNLKGQNRVFFPLDMEDPLHAKLLEQATQNEDGTLVITLSAEVRVANNETQDVSGLEF